jgi:hypothetical protein
LPGSALDVCVVVVVLKVNLVISFDFCQAEQLKWDQKGIFTQDFKVPLVGTIS